MADDVDLTTDREEQILEVRILNIRALAAQRRDYAAACLWCEEPTGGLADYCSADCRDDHAANLRMTEGHK